MEACFCRERHCFLLAIRTHCPSQFPEKLSPDRAPPKIRAARSNHAFRLSCGHGVPTGGSASNNPLISDCWQRVCCFSSGDGVSFCIQTSLLLLRSWLRGNGEDTATEVA